jgi:hypothetical protein
MTQKNKILEKWVFSIAGGYQFANEERLFKIFNLLSLHQ